MPKLLCYDTNRRFTSILVRKFAQGVAESNTGWKVECRILNDYIKHGLPNNVDMVCSLGILRGTGLIMQDAASRGINRLYMDHAYFNAGYDGKSWLRMTVNGHTMNRIQHANSDKWKTCFKHENLVLEWKQAAQRGNNILILPPTNAVAWYFGAHDWLETTIAQIKDVLPEQEHHLIKVRRKPNEPIVDKLGNLIRTDKYPEEAPLQHDLDNARVVIAYNSMVTIEATRQGIPVVCSKHNPCHPISFSIKQITNSHILDQEPNRKDLFFWLSECQYSHKERQNGNAWKHIIEKQLHGV